MTDIRDYSTTAASNTDKFPEGMAPSAVNDGMRTVQADIAKLVKDEGGTLTLGGTATAYTLTLNTTPASLADGLYFSATANTTATGGATTLVVTPSGGSAFASKKIKTYASGAEGDPPPGAMIANAHYLFQYDSAADGGTGAFILLNPNTGPSVLLLTGSVSSAAALDFSLPSGYKAIRFKLSNILPATSASALGLRASTDNGSSYISSASAYKYAMKGNNENAADVNTASAGNTYIQLTTGMPTAATPGSVEIFFPSYDVSGNLKPILINGASYSSGSSLWLCQNGMGVMASSTAAVTNVRFFMTSGNIASMTYQIFGER